MRWPPSVGGRWLAVFTGKRGVLHTPIAYRFLNPSAWSEPVALGQWYSLTAAQPETGYGFPLIVSNGSGLALVIWSSDKKALSARWVTTAP